MSKKKPPEPTGPTYHDLEPMLHDASTGEEIDKIEALMADYVRRAYAEVKTDEHAKRWARFWSNGCRGRDPMDGIKGADRQVMPATL
ncbi:hypothetical protein K3758_05020 [Sulfitobacter sp. W002]|uniref:hypothetical protein n=1 Tax=Sulfitobacter sp. W002 TaxID=2867024 RepID=UPI0021A27CCD|nr:hypothetical protein [Sulfitobacter sp. W002]UWR30896.1 hypothetical protein K3758_05020 [Sulfitobacter sp. W002]